MRGLSAYFANIQELFEGKITGFNNKKLIITANLTKSNFSGFLFQMDEITTFCQVSNYYQFELRNSVFFSFKKLHMCCNPQKQGYKSRIVQVFIEF